MADMILNSFDVWVTAQGLKSQLRVKNIDNISSDGINKLRELILDLAVRGKLVPQDLEDESSSVTIAKIVSERKKLVEEGKIKSQAPLPEISNNERPFDIPELWAFARLGEVTNYGLTEQFDPDLIDENEWVLELEDIEKVTSKLLHRVVAKERVPRSSRNRFYKGDVVYGKLRPYLDKVIVADENGFCTTEMIPLHGYVDIAPQFLRLIMKSPYFVSFASDSTHGMNLPRLGTEKARMVVIPVAPLKEQHRIIAKVDELMALCDDLEQQEANHLKSHQLLVETLLGTLAQAKHVAEFQTAWATLAQHFDDLFTTEDSIDQLKQTILQLAVMGKLVPQDPMDEPASVLLERIAKEKKRWVEEGKMKEQIPVPRVSQMEMPFELPRGWEFVRLKQIAQINPRNDAEDQVEASFVPMSMVSTSHTGEHQSETRIWADIKKGFTHFADGDIGIAKITPCFENSKAIILSGLKNGIGAGTTELFIARPFGENVNRRFILMNLKSSEYLKIGESKMTGTAGQKRLSKSFFESYPLPLPPLKEQYRIVAKVDESFALCDNLKERIAKSQTIQNDLASSVLNMV